MSAGTTGLLLGLAAAVGLVLVFAYAPPLRPVRLVDRLAPYVHDTPPPSRLLGVAPEGGLLTATRRLMLSAETSGVTVLSVRIGAEPAPSAAATRWGVAAAPSTPGNRLSPEGSLAKEVTARPPPGMRSTLVGAQREETTQWQIEACAG